MMEDLKDLWENAGKSPYDKKRLKAMTKLKSHPQLNRLKIKFIIEIIASSLFVIVYYDAFDGHQKPIVLNALLVFFTLGYILSDIAGMYNLYNPVQKGSLTHSLLVFVNKLKFFGVLHTIVSFLFGISVISFFIYGIDLNATKIFLLSGFLITLIILTLFSWKLWMRRIKNIENIISELFTD